MLSFKKYLIESLDVDKLKHLEHVEDHIIHGGHEGMTHAFDNLDDVHNMLSGKKSKTKVTTKFDGCMAGDTKVVTETGVMTLKDIYQLWSLSSDIKVLGYQNNGIGFTPVLDKLATKSNKEWVEITLQNGQIMQLTSDHKVMLSNGEYIEAGKIKKGDDLLSTPFL
jgi:hypothetical protein